MRRKMMDLLDEWHNSKSAKCLLIHGARQVGKTYIVERFAESRYGHTITINFSKDERAIGVFDHVLDVDSIILNLSAIYPQMDFVPHDTLIFLDEIQLCPQARTALKFFATDDRYDVIASGSLLGLRKNEVESYPVGYVHSIRMEPMDFEEFLWALDIKEAVIEHLRGCIREQKPVGDSILATMNQYLNWYMIVGGMPEAVKSFVERRDLYGVRNAHADITNDYKDDVTKHAEPSQRFNVSECFESIGPQLAKENKKFMYSDIGNGLSASVGADYYRYSINWLKDAGIIRQCFNVTEPHLPLEEREIKKAFKLYMVDTGLLVSSYDPSLRVKVLDGGIDVNRGAVAENLIAQMLSSQGRPLLYFRRDRDPDTDGTDRMEVDFLAIIGGELTVIEVKSGENRGCRSLNKVMERFQVKGMMFETRDIFVDDKGVRHYPMFAAAFMDAIDPISEPHLDFDSVDRLNSMF